ncbi:MAG: hypothetical protein Q8O56_12895 [Solirubrobacteraceae bacterium]|nr:hypothetical protein [Solirubrobacteraceae bacterium]
MTVPPEDQFGPTLRLHFDAEQAQQLRELLTIVCEEAAERAGGE